MSGTQLEWVAALVFIGLPVYHLMTTQALSARDDVFYRHLEAHSALFPRSGWIFGLAWTILFPAMGVAGFYFWRDADVATNGYTIGLVFYVVALMCAYGWMNMFFLRRMVLLSFFLTVFGVLACGGVFLGYSIFYGLIVSSILAGLWVAFTLYATVLSGVAAFSVPTYKEKTDAVDPVNVEPTPQQFGFDFEQQRARISAQQQQHQQFQQQQQQQFFPTGAPCPSFTPMSALDKSKLLVPSQNSSNNGGGNNYVPPGLVNRGGNGGVYNM
jgi:tryptophan-rich sensory protein